MGSCCHCNCNLVKAYRARPTVVIASPFILPSKHFGASCHFFLENIFFFGDRREKLKPQKNYTMLRTATKAARLFSTTRTASTGKATKPLAQGCRVARANTYHSCWKTYPIILFSCFPPTPNSPPSSTNHPTITAPTRRRHCFRRTNSPRFL